ncbi:septum formation initiator family protein [Gordonia sp. 852002-50816_SCH5313054-c]|uniref:FtsB family cell division protein n=1 Tax=unclassified Gordonia (in: high G+C Gram-positive bacteria) TaxID=2657482 RepID=UPI0007EA0B0B|nr:MULTISPECIES: septum formation initiator family protein [unclassified Gordonia (in: high G+C Gram-positive bacteria)]OBC09037.1 septum formation initiator family protein [Gordonia sp. 852002-50816_SCH5313054-a]OBC21477.1 septum formation initiator family protein [Gordonia sp. 852002-50816_SCH5313054-c]
MAQGSGRRRTRASTSDPRSRERARKAPRRERSTSRRSPVSVIETGEQEIYDDSIIDFDAEVSDARTDDVPDSESDSGDEISDVRRERERLRAQRRRRAGFTERMAQRLHHVDAKRAVVLSLVIGVVALTLAMPLRTYFSQHTEFSQLEESNAQLRDQVADYQQKVNEQNDPAYIEAKARERLKLVKPGETPFVMLYPDEAARSAERQREAAHEANSWYGNLWQSVSTPPGADAPGSH